MAMSNWLTTLAVFFIYTDEETIVTCNFYKNINYLPNDNLLVILLLSNEGCLNNLTLQNYMLSIPQNITKRMI